MSNVLYFPPFAMARVVAGGMAGAVSKDALQASLSPADRKCIALHVGKSGHINSPGSLFIERTMNAESLFASEEEAKRQTLVRL